MSSYPSSEISRSLIIIPMQRTLGEWLLCKESAVGFRNCYNIIGVKSIMSDCRDKNGR